MNLGDTTNMKYAQGSFITVPSRDVLNGLHPTAQALYMWLCSYANETGNCYPSRKTLAKNCACSGSMIDNMLDLLESKGLLKKKGRKEGDKQLSNLYTVLIVPPLPHSGTPPSTEYAPPSHEVRTNSIQLTQSNERGEETRVVYQSDSDQPEKKTPVIPHPYSIENTRAAWQDGSVRLQLLDWYLSDKGLWSKASTRAKLQAIMLRHSKAAERIERAGWTFGEVKKARSKIRENEKLDDEWTLETVEKYLTK